MFDVSKKSAYNKISSPDHLFGKSQNIMEKASIIEKYLHFHMSVEFQNLSHLSKNIASNMLLNSYFRSKLNDFRVFG